MRSRTVVAAVTALALIVPILAEDSSPVVATVNGEPVTKAEWAAIWKADQWHAPTVKKYFGDQMAGKPYEDYFFREEVVKIRAMSQKYREELAQMKTAIDAIYQKAKAGEDFAELAKKYSQEGSAPQGGDIGMKEFHELVFPFNRVAFALKEGEVSEPVLTIFGYHIVKAEHVFPANSGEGKDKRVQVRHILIRFPATNPKGEAETLASQAKVEVLDKGLCKKLVSYCPQAG